MYSLFRKTRKIGPEPVEKKPFFIHSKKPLSEGQIQIQIQMIEDKIKKINKKINRNAESNKKSVERSYVFERIIKNAQKLEDEKKRLEDEKKRLEDEKQGLINILTNSSLTNANDVIIDFDPNVDLNDVISISNQTKKKPLTAELVKQLNKIQDINAKIQEINAKIQNINAKIEKNDVEIEKINENIKTLEADPYNRNDLFEFMPNYITKITNLTNNNEKLNKKKQDWENEKKKLEEEKKLTEITGGKKRKWSKTKKMKLKRK